MEKKRKMKIPDLIKLAVEQENWEAICKVYTLLTGEELSPPVKKSEEELISIQDVPDEVLASLGLLEVFGNEEEEEEPVKKKEVEVDQEKTHDKFYINNGIKEGESHYKEGQASRKVPMPTKKRKNSFVDDLTQEVNELKANNPELRKLYNERDDGSFNRSPPRETRASKAKFKCTVCGKPELANPNLVVKETYRCNECSIPPAKRKSS